MNLLIDVVELVPKSAAGATYGTASGLLPEKPDVRVYVRLDEDDARKLLGKLLNESKPVQESVNDGNVLSVRVKEGPKQIPPMSQAITQHF